MTGMIEWRPGLKDIVNKADDIITLASGDTMDEAEKEHDVNLYDLMLRCTR